MPQDGRSGATRCAASTPLASGAARLFVGVLIGVGGLLGVATPVPAHGSGGADATNYQTTMVDEGDPGLDWRVFGGDALLKLTNRSGEQVVVVGYEPLLPLGARHRRHPRSHRATQRLASDRRPTRHPLSPRFSNVSV